MAIFNSSAPSFQGPTALPNTTAVQIFNTIGTPISAPTTDFPAGSVLSSITVLNVGANTCWLGTSSLTGTEGIPLKAGEQLTISNGNGHVAAESGTASWNLYGVVASGNPTTVEVSLGTTAVND